MNFALHTLKYIRMPLVCVEGVIREVITNFRVCTMENKLVL